MVLGSGDFPGRYWSDAASYGTPKACDYTTNNARIEESYPCIARLLRSTVRREVPSMATSPWHAGG